MDLSFLADPSTLRNISFIVTTPLLLLVTWGKFRSGNLSLSQSRTQRLYDLMQGQPNWDDISSGALQLAVESAMNVELPGDKIRFALRRDRPLAVLQALKLTRQLVKLTPDGQGLADARKCPKWTFETEFKVLASMLIVVYCVTMVAVYLAGNAHPILVCILFGIELVATIFLMVHATSALAAHRLLSPDFYRLPRAVRESTS